MPLATIEELRILRLKGTEEEMGYEHGLCLREQVKHLIEHYVYKSESTFEVPSAWLVQKARECAEFIPKEYLNEMTALAAGAEVPVEDILALNCMADIDGCHTSKIVHCCNFVLASPATEDGSFLHGRNLDFPPGEACFPRCVVLLARSNPQRGTVPTLTVGFSGFVGMFTGYSAQRLAIGEVGTPARDATLKGIPMPLLMRRALEEGESLEEAVKVFERGPRTCGYNLALSDGKSRKACCLETTHSFCEIRRPRRGVLVVDDVCFCRRTRENRLVYPAGAFRYARLVQIIKEHYGHITEDTALSFLKDRYDMATGREKGIGYNCLCNAHTLHSVLFSPSEDRLWVSHGTIPAPEGEYQPILGRDLWQ